MLKSVKKFTRKLNASLRRDESGFTLIEMAIATVILALLVAGIAKYFEHYHAKIEAEITSTNLEAATVQLENYRSMYGHYPCPSSLGSARDDADYGHEGDCTDKTTGAGFCSDNLRGTIAYCVQNSLNAELLAALNPNDKRVRIGALPFRDIMISEDQTYDGYGSKLYYAVTEILTDMNSFNAYSGGIKIENEHGQDLSDPPASVKFLVFSVGSDRVGAYTTAGDKISCKGTNTLDEENCDFLEEIDAVATAAAGADVFFPTSGDATFISAAINRSQTPDHIDDVLLFSGSMAEQQASPWRWGLTTAGENKNDLLVDSNVVLGSVTNAASAALTVVGNGGDIYTTGQIRTEDFCDENGQNCFKIADIQRTCPPGTYVTGIGDEDADPSTPTKVICNPVFFGCNQTQILAGQDPATNMPICIERPVIIEAGTGINCPPGETCETGGTCPEGLTCISGGTCPEGATCSTGGACPSGFTCTTAGNCPPGAVCLQGGSCPEGQTCTTGGPCPEGATCVTGAECPAGITCMIDGSCPTGELCVANAGDCPSGGICTVGGTCPIGNICSTDITSCPEGASCVSDGCPEGMVCFAAGTTGTTSGSTTGTSAGTSGTTTGTTTGSGTTSGTTTGTGTTSGTTTATTTATTTGTPQTDPRCYEETRFEMRSCGGGSTAQYKDIQVKVCPCPEGATNCWRNQGNTYATDCCTLAPIEYSTHDCGYGTGRRQYKRVKLTTACAYGDYIYNGPAGGECTCNASAPTYFTPSCSADKKPNKCGKREYQVVQRADQGFYCNLGTYVDTYAGSCAPADFTWSSSTGKLKQQGVPNKPPSSMMKKVGDSCSYGDQPDNCYAENSSGSYDIYSGCSCERVPGQTSCTP